MLDVGNILEGSVRKAGNALRITAQLLRATDGFHLWSKTYNRELKDIFVVKEDIATAVADELKVTLGVGKSFKQFGSTDNVEAYGHYLIAQGQWSNPEPTALSRALKSIDVAIALDPEFALAWTLKAGIHSAFTIFGPANHAASELDAAFTAAKRAIELEPKLGAAYNLLGFVKTNTCEWIDAETAYGKALELSHEALSSYEWFMAIHYQGVDYFRKAHDLLKEIQLNDPLNQLVRAQYMLNLAFLSDTKQAENDYDRGIAFFGGQWPAGDIFITHLRLGSGDVVSNDIVYSSPIYNLGKEHLNSPQEGLAELHRIYTNADNLSSEDLGEIAIWAAFFGDSEFALYAMKKALGIQTSGAFYLWFPVFKEYTHCCLVNQKMTYTRR